MKLLIITNNPERGSFRQRFGVYLDSFRSRGIETEVARLPKGGIARFNLFRSASEFDGVFLHKKGLNAFDAFWLRKYSRKLIFNFDDAVMFSDKHPERYSRSHFVPFRRSAKIADMIVVGSSYLAEQAEPFNSNVKILPLGLDTSEYMVQSPKPDDNKIRLTWVGSESTLSYIKEISPVLEEIGSRYENVVLRLICDDFFDLTNMPVEKYTWSKESRGIDIAGCDIGLAPLPDNRFTRGKCSFKVLEYSSACLPVVGSPVGTNSEHIRDGETGYIVNNRQEWVDKVVELIEKPELRQRFAQAGQTWAANFDVSIIGEQFCALISECLGDK